MTKRKILIKILLVVASLIIIVGAASAYLFYNALFRPNTAVAPSGVYLYIPTGGNFETVKDSLYSKGVIKDPGTFEWVADIREYTDNIKPGRYLITEDMSNYDLINMLRSGNQKPVKLTFNNLRTPEQLAGRIGKLLETDSLSIINLLNNSSFLEKYGLQKETALVMFLPDTYEFFWNTGAEAFIEKMHKEYMKFWTDERLDKAASIGLTATDVSVLASIVQSETNKKDEMARVAGVYINRLNRGMLLQADPTVIFAWGDFSIKRVTHRHLEIDSPYNTYKYAGLPPGPITMPEKHSIESVLNYERHNFLFFCAREDLSGYHSFAATHADHIVNARKYQKALNKLNIR